MRHKAIWVVPALLCAFCAKGHTEADTNRLIETMAIAFEFADVGPDHIEERDRWFDVVTNCPPLTMGGLFDSYHEFGWTSNEVKTAFDEYLLKLVAATNLDDSGMRRGRVALWSSVRRGYPEGIAAARSIMRDANAALNGNAWIAVADFAVPTMEDNAYFYSVLTNATHCGISERSEFYRSYSGKLSELYDSGNVAVATNGAQMLYSAVDRSTAVKQFDEFLVKMYPDYSMSSNRLVLAETYLSHHDGYTNIWDGYYIALTNQLLGSPIGLRVVPDLGEPPAIVKEAIPPNYYPPTEEGYARYDCDRIRSAIASTNMEECARLFSSLGYSNHTSALPFIVECTTNLLVADLALSAEARFTRLASNTVARIETYLAREDVSAAAKIKCIEMISADTSGMSIDARDNKNYADVITAFCAVADVSTAGLDTLIYASDPTYQFSKRRLAVMRKQLTLEQNKYAAMNITNTIEELVAYPESALGD